MTILARIRQWLQTYPGWEDTLTVDTVQSGTGSAGLFPDGTEELSRKEDILGNLQIQCRLQFTLRRQIAAAEDNEACAAWMLDFQEWVHQQSLAGFAPQFGDLPHREHICAEGGKLHKLSPTGIGTYTVRLIANFTKLYEVN